MGRFITTQTTRWKCSGASVIGNSHEANETECQDTWVKYIDQDVLAICVCDGAGSAEYSRLGADITSKIITQWLAVFFNEASENPRDVFRIVHSEIMHELKRKAEVLQCDLRALSCTLVAVAVDNAGRYIHWHLGDGGIIARLGDALKVLSIPQKGEYANETYFVTEECAAEHLQFGASLKEGQIVTGFAVFSDGLEMLLYDHSTLEVAPAVASMLNWHARADVDMVSKATEKNLTDVFRLKTNDDCSLVLLTLDSNGNI